MDTIGAVGAGIIVAEVVDTVAVGKAVASGRP